MDEIAEYNIRRWRQLAETDALFTRPLLHLTVSEAAQRLDPEGRLGELTGKRVLCLASGGGRQSAMFGLLGAPVTVFDLSQEQLQRDRVVADHYALAIEMMTERDWHGEGYLLKHPYLQGAEITYEDQPWVYERDGLSAPIADPREYQHPLSTIMNGLIDSGFFIQHVSDSLDMNPDLSAEPGTWDHFVAYVPPWLALWTSYHPGDGLK